MKNLLLLSILLSLAISHAQSTKYITKNGTIHFEASVPSFEEVKAKNETVTAILNVENGEVAALALIKGFRFKNALMEEHFNENYIESDSYPKATFKGKLQDFDKDAIKNTYPIKGNLTLHGVTKEINVTASISQNDETISLSASFTTKPEDFDIKIPGVVSKKIAEEVVVSFDFVLKPK